MPKNRDIAAVMCAACDAHYEADRVPDFCGDCGTIGGRWLIVWSEYVGGLESRLFVEPSGVWPEWALDEVEAELGDHFRRLPGS